jgi:hypothetical protein
MEVISGTASTDDRLLAWLDTTLEPDSLIEDATDDNDEADTSELEELELDTPMTWLEDTDEILCRTLLALALLPGSGSELNDELVDELIERLDPELALAGLEEGTTTELDDWLLLGPDELVDDRPCAEEWPVWSGPSASPPPQETRIRHTNKKFKDFIAVPRKVSLPPAGEQAEDDSWGFMGVRKRKGRGKNLRKLEESWLSCETDHNYGVFYGYYAIPRASLGFNRSSALKGSPQKIGAGFLNNLTP